MTLLVRDEADVVGEQIEFHLGAGVDFVIATDHRSTDGTTDILRDYERDGRLLLLREQAERIRQSEWVTGMARLAATDHGADWVINSDADEFWWARAGLLKDVLSAIPRDYAVVRGLLRTFVLRPGDGPFAERMTARLSSPAPNNDPATPFRPVVKVAHRGDPRVVVGQGNHDVAGLAGRTLRGWAPLEVLHFPLRSRAQCEEKHAKTLSAWEQNLRGDLARAGRIAREGGPNTFYDRVVVEDAALERGLAEGLLVEDSRLRDTLRALRAGRVSVVPTHSSLANDSAFAIDVGSLTDAEAVRLRRRVDELSARAARLDRRAGRHGL